MKKKKRKHQATTVKSNIGFVVAIVIFILLVAAYGAGGIYYSNHFYNGTLLNNCDVSGMTSEEAKAKLIESSNGYVLNLKEQNSRFESISGDEVDLQAVVSDDFDNLLNDQGGVAWLLHFFGDKEYILDESMITYTYDNDKLTDVIDMLDCVNPEYPIEATDAELVLLEGEFKIIPESESNIAHRDELEEKIRIAFETQCDLIDLVDEGLYDMPTVYSDDPDLVGQKAAYDQIVDMQIDLLFGYCEEYIDIQTIMNWVTVDKQDNGEYALNVDDDAITAYVTALSDKYDTAGQPKQFATNSGEVIEIVYGDFGWLFDNEYAEERLKEYVLEGKSVTLDLTDGSEESDAWWIQKGVGYDANGNDYYGTTYAEVSISEQHMWMYQDGNIVLETDVVTGNPTLGNDTPTGAFKIRHKEKDATLRGPGYATPVSYWMVFADDVGFHDATWQPSFGGERYLTNGSHGCVNMPLDQAEKLYDLIYIGMPVFVY